LFTPPGPIPCHRCSTAEPHRGVWSGPHCDAPVGGGASGTSSSNRHWCRCRSTPTGTALGRSSSRLRERGGSTARDRPRRGVQHDGRLRRGAYGRRKGRESRCGTRGSSNWGSPTESAIVAGWGYSGVRRPPADVAHMTSKVTRGIDGSPSKSPPSPSSPLESPDRVVERRG
jgi:hypothetical protein